MRLAGAGMPREFNAPDPLRSSVHTLAGSGRARYNALRAFVSPEFDFAARLAFQTACRFGKQNQTEQETNLLFPLLQFER